MMQATQEKSVLTVAVPKAGQLSENYQSYLKYVKPEDDLLELIRKQKDETQQFLGSIEVSREGFVYAPGKWQLKEVAGHVCDTERIMCYRALRIARNDKTPLPGFEENDYTAASNYSRRSLKNISEELKSVRVATITLIENFSAEMIDQKGIANNVDVSVRGIIFMIYVHQQHHMRIIRERYLS